MLLSAALPQHGPTPAPKLEAKMEKAGPLIYNAYTFLQQAQDNIEATQQQVKSGLKLETASANLASGEMLMQKGVAALEEGNKFNDEAEIEFQSSVTDPYGPPPEPSKSWGTIDAMSRRATSKLRTLKEEISDVKRKASQVHISLISVDSEKVVPVESWGQKQDDKLLDF